MLGGFHQKLALLTVRERELSLASLKYWILREPTIDEQFWLGPKRFAFKKPLKGKYTENLLKDFDLSKY